MGFGIRGWRSGFGIRGVGDLKNRPESSGFVPALPTKLSHFAAETGDGALNSVPVGVPLLLDHSLTVTFEHFPAQRECSVNLERSNVICANEGLCKQRVGHARLRGL